MPRWRLLSVDGRQCQPRARSVRLRIGESRGCQDRPRRTGEPSIPASRHLFAETFFTERRGAEWSSEQEGSLGLLTVCSFVTRAPGQGDASLRTERGDSSTRLTSENEAHKSSPNRAPNRLLDSVGDLEGSIYKRLFALRRALATSLSKIRDRAAKRHDIQPRRRCRSSHLSRSQPHFKGHAANRKDRGSPILVVCPWIPARAIVARIFLQLDWFSRGEGEGEGHAHLDAGHIRTAVRRDASVDSQPNLRTSPTPLRHVRWLEPKTTEGVPC